MTGHGQSVAGVLTRRLRPDRRLYPAQPTAVPVRASEPLVQPVPRAALMAAI